MSIKYAILGLLHYTDMHGYRIKDHIEKNFGHMWTINFGQIYTSLKDLEESGLIEVTEVVPSDDGGPYKKCYRITEEGKKDFAQWLHSSPEKQMLLRDPFLLRFAFFGFGDSDRAVEIIDEQIQLYEEQLRRRTQNLSRWRKQSVYVRLIADLGVKFNEMYLEWLKKAKEEIIKEKEGVLAKKA
ncbi:MAG: PadR family transcriptional regulator [Spirochaetes bacterium]|nr:PadR family transcriptional regulator [Spirochaetota bacterium]